MVFASQPRSVPSTIRTQEAVTGVRGNGDGSSLQYSVPWLVIFGDGTDGPPDPL